MRETEQDPKSHCPRPRRFQFRLRSLLMVMLLVALYLATWIGGAQSHRQALRARAQECSDRGVTWNVERGRQAAAGGRTYVPSRFRKGGPSAEVAWSFPAFPGILMVNSSCHVTPLWGEGGVKLVLYYGVGSVELLTLSGLVP